MKVHAVKEKVAPKLDDEFAKDVSEFETLADFRKDLGEKLGERREKQAQHTFEEALLEQVINDMSADIPDAMVENRAQQMLEDYSQRITSQGISFEQYLAMTGMTVDILKAQAMEGALRQVKVELALDAIAAEEKIEITEEEINAECDRLGEQYQLPGTEIRKIVPEQELKGDLTHRKAADLIYTSAKVGKTPAKKAAKKEEPKDETEKKPAAKKTAEKAAGEKKPAAKKTTKKAKTEE